MNQDLGPGKYAAAGTVLGLGFSLAALGVLGVVGRFDTDEGLFAGLVQVHRNEPLLYIIHCAPFVLGLFAWLVGVQQQRIRRFSEEMAAEVAAKTHDLQSALADTQRANETILHLAEHDVLTGLLNRARVQRDLERWGDHARRYQREVSLMFVDLDGFKRVNDEFGHAAGDDYLRGVAQRIRNALRVTDTLGRWGGDEFAVVLPETSAEQAAEVAGKVLEVFNRTPVVAGGKEWFVAASVGIAVMPQDTNDPEELIAFADAAMYQAKTAGGNGWRRYGGKAQPPEQAQEAARWEVRLRRALETEQFVTHYQPVLELATGRTPGYEALLRMEESDGTLVQPRLFLGYAEQCDLSVSIDRMVIRKAARRVAALAAAGLDVWVSVNLSAKSLRDPLLVEYVERILKEYKIGADRLAFEIDEDLAARYEAAFVALVRDLKALGVRIILDDFGLGIAAVYTLERFELDLVKLDGRLVRQADQAASLDLIARLAAMAHAQGAAVVAKCVEDATRIERLHAAGVDYVQGYAVGLPIEAVDPVQDLG